MRAFGGKAYHNKTSGNLHHWTLIVAAPIKKKISAGARLSRSTPTNPVSSRDINKLIR